MTAKTFELGVYKVVGSEFCVSQDDGDKVCRLIKSALEQGRPVTISFQNVATIASSFLNAAIGQLYGEFDEDFLRSHLNVTNVERADLYLLKKVVEGAKLYFRNPEAFNETRERTLATL